MAEEAESESVAGHSNLDRNVRPGLSSRRGPLVRSGREELPKRDRTSLAEREALNARQASYRSARSAFDFSGPLSASSLRSPLIHPSILGDLSGSGPSQ